MHWPGWRKQTSSCDGSTGPRAGILGLAALVSVTLFVFFQFNHAFYYTLFIDEAWMASVAKNLTLGYGWSTSYGQVFPFDPEITTGPGLLAFVALGIKAFGNLIWVPRVSALALNLLLCGFLVWRLRAVLGTRMQLVALILWPLVYSRISVYLWIAPVGEVTGFLYTALAATLVYQGMESGKDRLVIAGGLVAGLAWLTKLVIVISLGGILAYPLFHIWHRIPGITVARVLRQWVWLIAAMAMLPLLWWLYQQVILGTLPIDLAAYRESRVRYLFLKTGSGIDDLVGSWQAGHLLAYLGQRILGNLAVYASSLEHFPLPGTWFFVPTLLVLAASLLHALYRFDTPAIRWQLAILLPAALHLGWAIIFSDVWHSQHMVHGLFLAWFVLVAMIARHCLVALLFGFGLAGGIMYSLLASPPEQELAWPYGRELYRLETGHPPTYLALGRVLGWLESNQADRTLAGCGYLIAREVEYALPQVNRVVDCQYLLGKVLQFDGDAFLNRYPWIRKENPGIDAWGALEYYIADKQNFVQKNLVAPVKWTGIPETFVMIDFPQERYMPFPFDRKVLNPVTAFCRQILHDDGFFVLHECTVEDVHAYVTQTGGIDFYPPQWETALWQHHHGSRVMPARVD